jgi:hypothetical protein
MGSRRIAALVAGLFVTVGSTAAVSRAGAQRGDDGPSPPNAPAGKLVYADFERSEDGKVVSARGGAVSITSYQESDLHKTTTKGAQGGNTPELVRIKPDDPNRLAKFSFAFMAPNSYGGAGFEIRGSADVDGKTPADDVTGYKKITFQLYATGADMVRVEAISRGHGLDVQAGWPKLDFKVRPGLNTYEVALRSLVPPAWVELKPDPKKLLAKLTALNITAICEPCRPTEGMLILDNVTFEK